MARKYPTPRLNRAAIRKLIEPLRLARHACERALTTPGRWKTEQEETIGKNRRRTKSQKTRRSPIPATDDRGSDREDGFTEGALLNGQAHAAHNRSRHRDEQGDVYRL